MKKLVLSMPQQRPGRANAPVSLVFIGNVAKSPVCEGRRGLLIRVGEDFLGECNSRIVARCLNERIGPGIRVSARIRNDRVEYLPHKASRRILEVDTSRRRRAIVAGVEI